MANLTNRLFGKPTFARTDVWRSTLRKFNHAVLLLILVAMFDLLASSSLFMCTVAMPAASSSTQHGLSSSASSSAAAARLRPSASFLHHSSSSSNGNAPRRMQLRRAGLAQLQASPPNLTMAEFAKQFLPSLSSSSSMPPPITTTTPTTSSATTSSSVIVLGLHQPGDNITIVNARSGTNTTQMAVVRKHKQRNHVSLNIIDTTRRSKLQPKRISAAHQAESSAKAALAVAVPPLQSKALVMSPLAKIYTNINDSTSALTSSSASTTVAPPSVLTTAGATKKVVFREALSAAKYKQLVKNDTREREIEAASTTMAPGSNIIKLHRASSSSSSSRNGGTLLTKQQQAGGGTDGPSTNGTITLNGNSTKKSASMIETEHLLLLGALGAFGGGGMGGGGGGGFGGSYARTGGYPVAGGAPSPVGHFMGGGGFPMLGALALAEGFELGGDLMKGLMGMTMMSRMMGPQAQQQVGGGNGGTFGTEPYSPGGYVHTGVGLPA